MQGKEVAVKQYITYKVRVIQEGVMRSFNYEKKMMMCAAILSAVLILSQDALRTSAP